jgi:CubicO group peptidase (beta-lactamase class C family)
MAVPVRSLPSQASSNESTTRFSQLISSGVGGLYSGATVLIGQGTEVVHVESVGDLEVLDSNKEQRGRLIGGEVFDLGSLTAPIVLGPLVVKLINAGWVKATDRVSRYLSGFSTYGKSVITLQDLLNHTSGLPASIPFIEHLKVAISRNPGFLDSPATREMFLREINQIQISPLPGKQSSYSSIALVAAGMALESATGDSLDVLVSDAVLKPAGMKSTSYLNRRMLRRHAIEPDESIFAHRQRCPVREKIICAEVRDLFAWAFGGVSGSAGLFSTVEDLHSFAGWFTSEVLTESNFAQNTQGRQWGMCWEQLGLQSNKESWISKGAIGVVSETGCALVIDPERQQHYVFLSTARSGAMANRELRNHIFDVFRASTDSV